MHIFCTETFKKYSVTVILYCSIYICISIKPHFFKTLFQSQFLFNFDKKYLPTKAESNVVHTFNKKPNFEHQKNITMIVLLKTNNLSLCLNLEYFKMIIFINI
jgi:hypothetical protein